MSTTTDHLTVVQFEAEDGYRFWTAPLTDDQVEATITHYLSLGYEVDDIDASTACHCEECITRRVGWDEFIGEGQ